MVAQGLQGVNMAKYYITATRSVDGFPQSFTVSYDNRATNDYDNFMFFDTEEEVKEWIESDQAKEWVDCSFVILEDEE